MLQMPHRATARANRGHTPARHDRAGRRNEGDITNCHRPLIIRAISLALAMNVLNASAAAPDTPDKAEDAAMTSLTRSSRPMPAANTWLDPDRLDLNVYGLAYHPDREAAHRLNLDNEFNPGLGLRYELYRDANGITFGEVGFYKDSGGNQAKFAALGYQFEFGEYWKAGGALAAMRSRTYNRGVTFLAIIPLITLDLGRIKLNAVYFPKFGGYNKVDAFGFYLSIPFDGTDGDDPIRSDSPDCADRSRCR
jgi:hypothetical protein